MNFRGLDLNLLVAMDALLTERSTTRAGERIYLSQSAMSGALATLDFFCGCGRARPCRYDGRGP
jgi:LysR family transcriptional regulator, nod-box dependent transcriptional activator